MGVHGSQGRGDLGRQRSQAMELQFVKMMTPFTLRKLLAGFTGQRAHPELQPALPVRRE